MNELYDFWEVLHSLEVVSGSIYLEADLLGFLARHNFHRGTHGH